MRRKKHPGVIAEVCPHYWQEEKSMEKIGLGGGCHWCTEGIFQMLKGVVRVDQGYMRSDPPSDAWAEGVIAHFDPAAIDLAILVEVHLRTHSADRAFVPESKYRSAIYFHDDEQGRRAIEIIDLLQRDFEKPIETRVLPFRNFKPSDARYQNYYATDPERPFCRRFIDPKLEFLRRTFAESIISPD